MKILVTGGAGFIGSHLVDGLLEAGHDVVIVDDLSRGRSENLNSAARFERLDICDPQIESLFSAWQPEVVMHQAALANVRESFEDPLEYARVNVLGSLNLIEFSRSTPTGRANITSNIISSCTRSILIWTSLFFAIPMSMAHGRTLTGKLE